ncbi:MAG: DUF115 domain-containing protein [Methanobacteriaceae archaeon]|nr:DUF115 domain-containing protein [Methanobacteriaceae archaeon]
MDISQWMTWYEKILEDFGFSRYYDEESAELLNRLLNVQGSLALNEIPVKEKAIILGAGPSLKRNIVELKSLVLDDFLIIAADGATTALLEEDVVPDVVVTDLDGEMESIFKANQAGAVMVVHAHGDNSIKIKKHVHELRRVIGTTQSTPLEHVYNFGGFTDGDRAVFLAVELGVKVIVMAGMDFGKVTTRYSRPELGSEIAEADQIKQLKLEYAKELVEWVAENEEVLVWNISGGESLRGVEDILLEEFEDYIP